MSDNLEIFGLRYPNIDGIKAIDENGNELTYSRYPIEIPGEPDPTPVKFLDYDGTVLYSYSAADFLALSAMPANPSHSGLVAQGWNWELTDAQAYVSGNGSLVVGQLYTTSSGATEIDIDLSLAPFATSLYLALAVNGSVSINWGDGSAAGSLSGTSLTTTKYISHTYSTVGNYTITVTEQSGSYCFYLGNYACIINAIGSASSSELSRAKAWAAIITAIRTGAGLSTIGNFDFKHLCNVEYITVHANVTTANYTFEFTNCYSLLALVCPPGLTKLPACPNCYSMGYVSLNKGAVIDYTNAFSGCSSLLTLCFPPGTATLSDNVCANCYSLRSAILPYGITSISAAFVNCYALQSITLPGSITSLSGTFNGAPLRTIILPSSLQTLGAYTFKSSCAETVVVPEGVTALGEECLRYGMFISISLPSTLQTIGSYSLGDQRRLTHITIPAQVTTLSSNAFYNSPMIREYHFLPVVPPSIQSNTFSGIGGSAVIYVPYSSDHSILNAYKTATNWATHASKIVEEPND